MSELRLKVPSKLFPVAQSISNSTHRIIVVYGGRGGGKSISLTDISLAQMIQKPSYKILALREFMNSINDSMHSMLKTRIETHNQSSLFKITNNTIESYIGASVIYGQLARNIESLKSKDEVNLALVEEAETVSNKSLEVLEPSIRAKGSQIVYLLNPKDEDGAVYSRYIKPYIDEIDSKGFYETNEDGGLLVIKINLDDNPFAPQELIDDSNRLKRNDPVKWRHIYGGEILLEDDDDNLVKADSVIYASKSDAVERTGALVIGVDPARFGKDKTAIIRRQGREAYNLAKLSNQSTMEIAGRIALIIKLESPDMVFIDVGGLGAGIYDRLVELGYGDVVKAVNFGGKASQPERYLNKRAEMWSLMGEWLDEIPVSIPDDASLVRDLVTPKYKIRSNGQIQLESKDEMKKRLGRSTDSGDALALTFAYPVAKRDIRKEQFYEQPSFIVGDSTAGY